MTRGMTRKGEEEDETHQSPPTTETPPDLSQADEDDYEVGRIHFVHWIKENDPRTTNCLYDLNILHLDPSLEVLSLMALRGGGRGGKDDERDDLFRRLAAQTSGNLHLNLVTLSTHLAENFPAPTAE